MPFALRLTDVLPFRHLVMRDPDPSASPDPPLTALQRLSLSRRAQSTHGKDGSLRGAGRGRGRGRGRGIGTVGRSLNGSHTKQNGSMDEEEESRGAKRPAESSGSEAQTSAPGDGAPRPSKLAALAAARAAGRAGASGKPSQSVEKHSSTTHGIEDAGRPLSKLQQKMQANLLARQQRRMGMPSREEEAQMQADAEMKKRAHLLPSGDAISSLFPDHKALVADTSPPRESVLGSMTGDTHVPRLDVPGGSPFLAAEHLEAFSKPSPDDMVQKAREGTSLART